MKKEALFYHLSNDAAYCELCPHYCKLSKDRLSMCKTRIFDGKTLQCLSYGTSAATNIDPVEKKPLFHFLPGSRTFSVGIAGCNLHCKNCQNAHISQITPEDLYGADISPEEVVESAIANNCLSISYTYTEPTVFYEFMLDTARLAKEKGLRNIMVSNGYINQRPLLKMIDYLDAVNIDLKVFSNEIYKKISGGKLKPVLDTILTLHNHKKWIEITNLLIPGITDHPNHFMSLVNWMKEKGLENVPLHLTRFFPSYQFRHIPPSSIQKMEDYRKDAYDAGIKFVYLGNIAGSESSDTLCPRCHKPVIIRSGYALDTKLKHKNECPICGYQIHGRFE